ncbi:MAG TPA: glycogen debranching N-terminal domain-containing protein, partial [Nocardioides sp.]|nr:glycogen debranching N-terminal domain-containing protein [Nocardioides sp.]
AVSRLDHRIDAVVDWVGTEVSRADRLVQRYIVRGVGESTMDPEIVLTRELTLAAGEVTDRLAFANVGTQARELEVCTDVASDLAGTDAVWSGRLVAEVPPEVEADVDGVRLRWASSRVRVTAAVPALPDAPRRVVVPPGESVELVTRIEVDNVSSPIFLPVERPERLVSGLRVEGSRHDLVAAVSRSVADLRGLLLSDAEQPADCLVAAGSPWYLTLFGRDSLWAARFLLLTGTDLAMGTLRALARRQATATDPASEAQPGKILHEVRAAPLQLSGGILIPPLYYGSIDATALWVSLLHGAWKHGAPQEQVAALLPNLEAALDWLAASTASGGFLRYVDSTGHGLANQGWKDSVDGVRHRDGSRGEAPIALCEVQAYAYAAAMQGAELQRAFGGGDPDRREEWAEGLAERFRAAFWVDSPEGPHPAIALDAHDRPVSALTSNIGHLLGTGLCDAEESAAIARLLVGPELNSGYGVRTMASTTTGYNPLGYHTGSVWAHDTMIAASGLAADGFRTEAELLVTGLLDASTAFRGRLPELFGGYPAVPGGSPTAYAAACHPQGWAAAAVVEGVRILLGLDVDGPSGRVSIATPVGEALRGHRVDGLVIDGEPASVEVSLDGELRWDGLGLDVVTGPQERSSAGR